MSLSESEFYEAGMSLPPDVRKHVALRLLESVDPDEAFDLGSESGGSAHRSRCRLRLAEGRSVAGCHGRGRPGSTGEQVGRPFMTGGINLTPEAERQLNELDDWITERASAFRWSV